MVSVQRPCSRCNPSPARIIFIPKHFYASTHFIFQMLSPGVWQMVKLMRKGAASWRGPSGTLQASQMPAAERSISSLEQS